MKIFNEKQLEKANFILNSPYSKLSDLSSEEIKNLAIVWCYYSGKIEGNTYSYVETDVLLREGISSVKKFDDAKMLKNLYNAFISVVKAIRKEDIKIPLRQSTVLAVHSIITKDLLNDKDRGILRKLPVKITGTNYVPPGDEFEISEMFNRIFTSQTDCTNPLEQAVYLHCNIARLQPFIDGNKRNSRLVESIVMMNANIIPVYSAKDEDILNYRKGILHFYETGDYSQYANYFLDRQLSRLQDVSPKQSIPPKSKGKKLKITVAHPCASSIV
ncbi:cell division protein [Bacteroidia bacterium]|nr:cell division protein [Bacteroidia bacterium]